MEKSVTSVATVAEHCSVGHRDGAIEERGYRWFALFIVWFAFLLSYVGRAAWSTVAAPVGTSLGIQVAQLGTFMTAFYVGYVLANIVAGMLTDRLGGRLMMTCALIPLGIFTALFGNMHSLATGIAIQFAMGIAAGADYSSGVKIISAWFTRDRGRAMGIYTTGTSLAVVLANAIVPTFSLHYGWSNAFRVIGLMTFLWGIAALLLLRNAPATDAPSRRHGTLDILALVRHRNLLALAVAGCGGLWGTVGFGAWSNALMTKHHGISPVVAGSIIALFGVGAVIAKPTLGWISDLPGVSKKWLATLCLVGFAGGLVVFGFCSNTTQFYFVAPLLGAFAFGYLPVLIAQVSDASGKSLAGASAGLTNAIWQSGSALAPVAVGQVYAGTHSFQYALLALAAGPVVGIAAMLFVQRQRRIS